MDGALRLRFGALRLGVGLSEVESEREPPEVFGLWPVRKIELAQNVSGPEGRAYPKGAIAIQGLMKRI